VSKRPRPVNINSLTKICNSKILLKVILPCANTVALVGATQLPHVASTRHIPPIIMPDIASLLQMRRTHGSRIFFARAMRIFSWCFSK
ncbi:MAG TPA: hypothetical protein PKD54_09680, partial [Pirellulaceae bacterium]|nr:hypothetical protein [Pirellulaceae bacterium]